MKFLKTIAIFLIFVFCFGFIAGFLKGSDIDFGWSFPWESAEVTTEEPTNDPTKASETEEPTEEPTEASTESSTEESMQDSTESSSESTTETSSDEIDFSQLSINCLGDSVTHGAACPTYIPALQEILGFENCRNYGQGGSTICAAREDPLPFVERYSSMDDDADIILVFGGFNDFSWCSELGDVDSIDPFTFYGALNTLSVGLQEKYPDAYIFFVTPYKRYNFTTGQVVDGLGKSEYGYSYSDLNDAINTVGQKHGIDVLDLFNLLEIDENSTTDSLHPTEDFANNVLAPTIAQFIKDNYKKPN